MKQGKENFHETLKLLLDQYAHSVYNASQKFPREEIFGITSQLKRAGISVVLNYLEGYARQRPAVLKNFVETSYGSLKESTYIIGFAQQRKWITKDVENDILQQGDRIGKMLWGIIKKIE